jgi:Flp pilus assembly protein CpaB
MEDIREVTILLIVLVFVFIAVVMMGLILNHTRYVSRSAEIGQLRRDVTRVNVAESEDVIGQVTQANQEIARWQRWNSVPLINLLVSDGWDRETLIELPAREPFGAVER